LSVLNSETNDKVALSIARTCTLLYAMIMLLFGNIVPVGYLSAPLNEGFIGKVAESVRLAG